MALELEGVSISASEEKKVSDALAELAKNPGAPRELTVRVTLHVHHEYPKHLHKGKEVRVVQSSDEEEAARADGFGKFTVEE